MSLLNVFKPSSIACSLSQGGGFERSRHVRPRYEISEDQSAYYVDVDLPGVGKKDVGVTLHDGLLELIGERNWTPPKGWKAVNGDNESYSYRLRLMVGDRVEEGSISAETINGVLRLTLPKEEEKRAQDRDSIISLRGLGWRRFSGEGTGAFLLVLDWPERLGLHLPMSA